MESPKMTSKVILFFIKIFLTTVLLTSILVTTVFAEIWYKGSAGPNISYTYEIFEGGGYMLTLTGDGDMYDDITWFYGQSYNEYMGLVIGEGITSIGDYAFDGMGVQGADLPESITRIGEGAFKGCNRINGRDMTGRFYIPKNVSVIENYAFEGTKSIDAFDVNPENQYYCDVNGVLYTKDMTTLVQYPCGKADADYTLPSTVTKINDGALWNCDSLQNIYVEEGNTAFSSIDGVLFSKDGKTLVVYPTGKTTTSYKIPDGVTTISSKAFNQCIYLETIRVPEGVKKLQAYTFNDCDSLYTVFLPASLTNIDISWLYSGNLSTIYSFGTASQWSNITSGKYSSSWSNAAVHYLLIGDAIEPTCHIEGASTYEYYDSYYGEVVVTPPEVIPATGDIVIDEAVAQTCTETGLTEGSHCSVCGEILVAQEIIPANGHTEITYAAIEETCTTTGLTAGIDCTVCGVNLEGRISIQATGHNRVVDAAEDPTCTSTGLTSGSHCSECHEVFKAQKIIPTLGHKDTNNDNICDICNESTSVYQVAAGYCKSERGIIDDIWWSLWSDGSLHIDVTSYGANSGSADAFRMASAGSWDSYKSQVKSIKFDDRLTKIVGFSGFSNLCEPIVFPSGLKEIGASAFYACSNLPGPLNFPSSLETIGASAFKYCANISGNIVIPKNVTTISEFAFEGCGSSSEDGITVDIEYGVKNILYKAFYASGLTRISLPESVTNINVGGYQVGPFANTKIKELTLPSSLSSVTPYLCKGCTSLKKVVLPNNAQVSQGAFSGCTNLTDIYIQDMHIVLGASENYFIVENILEGPCRIFLASDYEKPFNGCSGVSEINVLPGGVVDLRKMNGNYGDVHSIIASNTSIITMEEKESLNSYAGHDYVRITALEKGTSVITALAEDGTVISKLKLNIHEYDAWQSDNDDFHTHTCSCGTIASNGHKWNAGEVIIQPSHLAMGTTRYTCSICGQTKDEQNIDKNEDHVYKQWINIDANTHKSVCECGYEEIVNHELDNFTKKDLDSHIVACDCGLSKEEPHSWNSGTITVYPSADKNGEKLFTCTKCGETKCEEYNVVVSGKCGNNATYSLDNKGVLTISGSGAMYNYSHSMSNYNYTNSSTTSPWNGYKNSIKKVVIENGITSVGKSAFFAYLNLTEVVLPDSLNSVGEYAFGYCKNLSSINLPNTIITIGQFALYDSNLTKVTIPTGVTSIAYATFGYAPLNEVHIHSNVTSISSSAFSGNQYPKNIYYDGTQAQWKEITGSGYYPNNIICLHVLAKEPTCTENGNIEYWLGYDGTGYYTDSTRTTEMAENPIISSLGHVEVIDEAVKQTCTETGLTEGKHCSRCNTVLIKQEIIPLHTYGEWISDGNDSHSHFCSCGASETEKHTYTNWECVDDSCHKAVCTFCGETKYTSHAWAVTSSSYGDEMPFSCRICWESKTEKTDDILASGYCGSYDEVHTNVTWILRTDGIMTIHGNGKMDNYSYNISPGWQSKKSNILKVVIEDGVTTVGDFVFRQCTNLKEVTIAGSATAIGASAFSGCSSLESVNISEGVKLIDYNAFTSCANLSSIDLPSTIEEIYNYAFSGCTSLESVSFSKAIKSIDRGAFNNCTGLTAVLYDGSSEDWANVTVGDLNEAITDSIVFLHQLEKEPTCTEPGNVEYWLGYDGTGYYTDSTRTTEMQTSPIIVALGHSEEVDPAVAATCTSTGLTEGSHCSRCTEVIVAQESTPKLQHEYGKWTKVDDNNHSRTCECSDTQTKAHEYGDWSKVDANTHKHTCHCGHYEIKNHTWNDGEITTPPTQTSLGVMTYTCTGCPETKTEDIPMISGSILGSVRSFGDETANITIELLEGSDVLETKIVVGNNATYSFDGLASGTYTIRVSKSKHCTREYEVVVNDTDVTLNVEIWLYGDVNGDGNVNHIDVLQINRNISSQTSVFDAGDAGLKAYRFKVANVTAITGSDKVLNHIDVLQINRKIAKLSSIFDSLD